MKAAIDHSGVKAYQGCVLDVLPLLEASSVHMIATSPPFYGLRKYPVPDSVWPVVSYAPMAGLPEIAPLSGRQRGEVFVRDTLHGEWHGQLGLEPTPEMYVGHIVHVFRLLRRVLRDDGTAWLNLGSSYAPNGNSLRSTGGAGLKDNERRRTKKLEDIQPKNDLMIPHRVALALQADGWIVRSAIVWAKGVSFCKTWSGSVMPGSQQDRPTSAYEMVFLLSKNERYFYDQIAVKEKAVTGFNGSRFDTGKTLHYNHNPQAGPRAGEDGSSGRTLRNVWTISPKGSSDSHYAGWPAALVAPMIRAGTSQRGVCAACGAPYERIVERTSMEINRSSRAHIVGRMQTSGTMTKPPTSKTIGWQKPCPCDTNDIIPATVLDCFGGRGTTARVAQRLGRRAVTVDAAADYVDLQRRALSSPTLFSPV